MECGKLTAKLRDAVPVCFIEEGKEVKRFKNIEIPDEIKKLPFETFKFDVPETGAITFKIYFAKGILPAEWPEARQRKSRGSKSIYPAEPEATSIDNAALVTTRIPFNVTGEKRKELVTAISEYTGQPAVYQNAPTFAYRIGEYIVDKNGTFSGPNDHSLINWLNQEGFIGE